MRMIKRGYWGEGNKINKITYPVPLTAFSAKEAPYVYTQMAEDLSRSLGVELRKKGTIAMLGGRPLDGLVGKEWMRRGYVVLREDAHVD